MTDFLTDTLVWTGALIAMVLVLRRPAARFLGAQAAYALWALPAARLLLPPIHLPAWLAPAAVPVPPPVALAASDATALALSGTDSVGFAFDPVATAPVGMMAQAFDWAGVLLAVWLAGAAAYLVRRYALYFRMRRELLVGALPVGEAGRVRFVETPAADGPVAFGVIDKVVALPPGFMAMRDRAARDLALVHELAHHRGHDLLCNMLIQPLFALHWFNPLAALGWRALRRDQEAACDARVIARQPRERRAAYAAVIARFATQTPVTSRLALAAPMACPVLGDRSIVQRLRSLAMSDVSHRRRLAGRLCIGAAVLALPLTGSISYAQQPVPPLPPEPPIAPLPPEAPVAPPAPVVPVAPPAPVAPVAAPAPPVRIVAPAETPRVVRIERRLLDADKARQIGREARTRGQQRVMIEDGHGMSAQERAEFEKEMAGLDQEMARLHRELGPDGSLQREIQVAVAEARAEAHAQPRVRIECRAGQREVAESVATKEGETLFVCQSLVLAEARKALAMARSESGRARELAARQRERAARPRDLTQRERDQAARALEEAARRLRAD